eukprot:CAMPEP_0172555926 /NCGR_PEP_ID=MMETSP1067-20121228/61632_1 /TAXON_ID=265564 ORGANISM="Thalassiosira punctigera, Strain Tpunct2005C2" /NCGR_SAMPLE_ID=MMETSP1067 /ASSEMBLY_ACC=CAM_ASM_000444 /LENGTH=51 /DNA_ID=CAMNT_0013344561 /DNA_START=407 /DNA_END=559 /DNA_ORIENTATION=+
MTMFKFRRSRQRMADDDIDDVPMMGTSYKRGKSPGGGPSSGSSNASGPGSS